MIKFFNLVSSSVKANFEVVRLRKTILFLARNLVSQPILQEISKLFSLENIRPLAIKCLPYTAILFSLLE